MSYHVNEKGYYGQFGGAFIPEMLYPNIEELRQKYLSIMAEPDFKAEFDQLLKSYVGRPTPLYYASVSVALILFMPLTIDITFISLCSEL